MKLNSSNIMHKPLLSLLIVLLVSITPIFGQDGFGDPNSDVPIDGGLSLLIAAGVGYGAKKVHQKRKQTNPKA